MNDQLSFAASAACYVEAVMHVCCCQCVHHGADLGAKGLEGLTLPVDCLEILFADIPATRHTHTGPGAGGCSARWNAQAKQIMHELLAHLS